MGRSGVTGARLKDGSLSEPAFQSQVLGLAAFYGWRTYHPPDNKPTVTRGGRVVRQRVTPGYPDLTLVRGAELLFVELKAEKGRLDPAQREWLDAFRVVGDRVVEVTSRDLLCSEPLEGEHGGEPGYCPAVEVHIWRPSDWPVIEKRLARGRVLQSHPSPVGEAA